MSRRSLLRRKKLGYDPIARAWPGWLDRLVVSRVLLPKVHRILAWN